MRSRTNQKFSLRAQWQSVPAIASLTIIWIVTDIALTNASSNDASAQSSVRPPANATSNSVPGAGTPAPIPGRQQIPDQAIEKGEVPAGSLDNRSETDIWRVMREGTTDNVSIPGKKSGQRHDGSEKILTWPVLQLLSRFNSAR